MQVKVIDFKVPPSPKVSSSGWATVGILEVKVQMADAGFCICNVQVKQKDDKTFVALPSYRTEEGKWEQVIVFPDFAMAKIREAVLNQWEIYLRMVGVTSPPEPSEPQSEIMDEVPF